ncbi:selection and upkeep of intraepithelial T-cells protein 1-like [Papio anubis]|uniref:selection and upkeep of intraepithelial T-cells protein 1-like n=1 Tax=Papio anubis TaxID=9555 RepID=UPI0012ADAC28|nr:selection and upkeep of intraepithelial T-cells protein 1-like [Papio anubis]
MEVRWFRSQFSPAVFVYKGGRERTEEQMEEYRRRTTFVSKDISRGIVALIIHNVTAQENGTYRCYFQEGRSYDEAILHLMVAGALLHFALLLWHSVTLGKVSLPTSCPLQTSKFFSGIPFPQGDTTGTLSLWKRNSREKSFLLHKGHTSGFALLNQVLHFLRSTCRIQLRP